MFNPASTMSSSQILPVQTQPVQTAHSPQSVSETIASFFFEDVAACTIRRLQRESKGKVKDE
jgi:hypothetical protein